jgi:hypothetical protein
MEILEIASPILAGMVFSRFDRFIHCGQGPDQPPMIGLAFQVGGCRRLWPEDAVLDRQPNDREAVADSSSAGYQETTVASSDGLPTHPQSPVAVAFQVSTLSAA